MRKISRRASRFDWTARAPRANVNHRRWFRSVDVGFPLQQAHPAILPEEIAELSEQLNFDPGVVEILRDVFLSACGTLQVSEPTDPLSATIARTLIIIALASEGECDARELYRRTMSTLRSVH